jgi:hypothetical protein
MAAAALALAIYLVRVQGIAVGLVTTLIVTSVTDHFTFSIGPLALRAEQVAALIALAVLAVVKLRERDFSWLKPSLAEGLLLAWLVIGITGSLLASPDKRLSFKIVFLIAICSLGFLLPRRLLAGQRLAGHIDSVVFWLLVIFATESAYGVIAYILHVFGPTIGLTPNPASGHLSAYGTLWEQNVFGAFAAAGGVAWVYLRPSRFRWAVIGLAACVGGLFDSLTRAAWLAAALVGALGVALPSLRRRIDFRQVVYAGLGGAVVVAATLIVDRVGNYNVLIPRAVGGPDKGGLLAAILNIVDLVGRANQTGPVWGDVSGHLALGRGIASYQALHVVNNVPQHIASLPLLILHDTGMIGLLVFTGFVVAVIVRAWVRRGDPIVVGLGQTAIVVGLTNLATETTELMIGWLLIGVLMAAVDAAPPSAAGVGLDKRDTRAD